MKKVKNHYNVNGEELILLPDKCIYWQKDACLFVSDLHLGKVDHFRKNGIAIPSGARQDNYTRLGSLLESVMPSRVIILGDLFHSDINEDWFRFERFIQKFKSVSFELVKGNHDILDNKIFDRVFDKLYDTFCLLGPFLLSHEPTKHQDFYNLCGHIHPSVKIYGKGRQSIRLPCFYFTNNIGILPAFGSFTGTYTIEPSESDDVFIIADNEVIKFS